MLVSAHADGTEQAGKTPRESWHDSWAMYYMIIVRVDFRAENGKVLYSTKVRCKWTKVRHCNTFEAAQPASSMPNTPSNGQFGLVQRFVLSPKTRAMGI